MSIPVAPLALLPEYAAMSRMLTTKQTQALLGVGPRFLWKMTKHPRESERIPSYKIGKLRKYRFDEVMHWLENHRF